MAASAETIREQTRKYLTASLSRQIADDEDIFATGLVNSLFAVQLVAFVETRFGITVENEELNPAYFSSAEAITAFVVGKTAAQAG
jgi:acyl carrier protein